MPEVIRTVEQIILGLALEEVPCPLCKAVAIHERSVGLEPGEVLYCRDCHGTGQVARFPMLREPCPGYNLLGVCIAEEVQSGKSMRREVKGEYIELTEEERQEYAKTCGGGCQGRGWLPATTTDALLEAAEFSGWDVAFAAVGLPADRWRVRLTARDLPDLVGVRGDWAFSRSEAIALALEAASK